MEELVRAQKYDELAEYLEEEELKSSQCIPSAEIYGTLLGVYLVQNELDHAKLLWQRIPKAVKQEHKEVSELWEIGKRLWRKEFAAVYELARNPKWPAHLEPLVTSIVERLRERVLLLVGKSYSAIRLSDLSSLLGLSHDQTSHLAETKGWTVDSAARIVSPKPISVTKSDSLAENQEKLQKLTDIISFLEN